MQDALKERRGVHWADVQLPSLYGPAAYFWFAVFGTVSTGLAVLYVGFVWSGAHGLFTAFQQGESETAKYLTPLI